MIKLDNLKVIRTHIYWFPLSIIWHKFHKFIYFNFFNKGLENNSKRNEKLLPYKIENPELKEINLTSDLLNFFLKDSLLLKIKEKMLSSNLRTSYTTDIYNHLDLSLKSKLFLYAISDQNIQNYLEEYFGFKPRLHDVSILYNIYREGLKEEGSKLWHRDTGDCDLRQIKVFIPISKINSNNGPFFFLKNKNLAKENIAIKGINGPAWIGGRVSNKTIKKLNGNIFSTEGINKGTKIYFDSKRIYHKGGFSKGEDRLMIQFSYLGNAYCATPPQDFSKEILFLKKSKDKKLQLLINDYLKHKKNYLKITPFKKYIRYIFFRVGMMFTYYIKK